MNPPAAHNQASSAAPAQPTGPPDLPGYRFIRDIGAGGNAKVYLYEQELPSRKVAVKVLNDSALSEAARRRFTAEANVTAVLAHRHIVQVFDAKLTADGRPYIVMPFYPQPNLAVRARRAHFSIAEVLRIGIQVGSAVETSHRHGVLHRDIKPQNILTDSYGEPALTDFGIATTKAGDGPEGLSVPWSPPEILFGTGPGDERSDVYSLGATLWHLLAGRPPFEHPSGGNATQQVMERIYAETPPRTQRADVPESLERLLRQTMAKDTAARPQSAMELIRGLQSIEQELRLPLTHPILPTTEPEHEDTRGDTVARPALRGADAAFADEPDSRSSGSGASGSGFSGSGSSDSGSSGSGPSASGSSGSGSAVSEAVGRAPSAPTASGAPIPGSAPSAPAPSAAAPLPVPADLITSAPAGPPPARAASPSASARDASAFAPPGPAEAGDADDLTIVRGRQAPAFPGQPLVAGRPPVIDASPPAASAQPSALAGQPPSTGQPSSTVGRPAEDFAPPARPPIVLDPSGGVPPPAQAPRQREFPAGQADDVTVLRPAGTRQPVPQATGPGQPGPPPAGPQRAEPPEAETGRPSTGQRRVLLFVGGGVLLAVAVVAALLAIPHGSGAPSASGTSQATQPDNGQNNALGPAALAPGQPVVTVRRLSSSQVEFSWTYTNTAPGDTFHWQQLSGTAGQPVGVVDQPDLILPVGPGQSECIAVTVRSADGQASQASDPVCAT